MLKYKVYTNNMELENLFSDREIKEEKEIEDSVRKIVNDIRANGDISLREYTKKFDGAELETFLVSDDTLKRSAREVSNKFFIALEEAKENIEKFHKKQVQNSYIDFSENGVFMGQKVLPLERVGVYVPGGTAAYPSSVLMNVIPAKVAGVKEVIMVTPPSRDGGIDPCIAAAAIVAGVDKVYNIGGAQAVAALAFGTKSVPKVDKIVGPGNIYVATAKKLVYGIVDIDMIAGPSEILVIADKNANPRYIAADMLSQAEHDRMAASILVTDSMELYEEVNNEIKIQTKSLSRKSIITESIEKYGLAIICENIDEAINVANEFAPEHLELIIDNPMNSLEKIKNAASVFLGENTPEPVGDYFAGVNHVLPTNRTAKFSSPLSVDSFIKKISFTNYTREALLKNGEKIMLLARREGLTAHENSIKVRLEE